SDWSSDVWSSDLWSATSRPAILIASRPRKCSACCNYSIANTARPSSWSLMIRKQPNTPGIPCIWTRAPWSSPRPLEGRKHNEIFPFDLGGAVPAQDPHDTDPDVSAGRIPAVRHARCRARRLQLGRRCRRRRSHGGLVEVLDHPGIAAEPGGARAGDPGREESDLGELVRWLLPGPQEPDGQHRHRSELLRHLSRVQH